MLDAVYSYLDGEIDPQDRAQIRVHLEECGPCLAEYGLEEAVKKLIAKHCGCEQVPADLRSKVLNRIEEVRVQMVEGRLEVAD
ncbi:mycothiol system anti-sigma-R factor [Thermocatellispora tengchongensis]|uniref:Mycothiol system anti-sigma-R factor n=1 Tax=Thermocatellispora tengchongensis TaxID=1073253 RepID=A0A840P2K7_9ACTN|nr:mycothiol system anti-sigma-R factor [Thermocatellispora tengchongensis]